MASPRPMRPLRLVVLVLFCAAIAGAWKARTFFVWQLASADLAPIAVGPASLAVPESLPARFAFGPEGDVTLVAGDTGYDPMALTLQLTPLGEPLAQEAAESARDDLERALQLDERGASIRKQSVGVHPGFVADLAREGLHSRMAVVVAGGALVRLEVQARKGAPDKWQRAADEALASLALEEVIAPDVLWSAFSSGAWDACGGGEVDACLWTARSSLLRGRLDGARAALERAEERVGDIEALWEEAKASAPGALLSKGLGATTSTTPTSSAERRLGQAVEIQRLFGELALARGEPGAAVEAWRRSWRFDADGRTAERMLTHAAPLVDEDSAARFLELARAADERFGQEPKVALAAAHLASRAGDFSLAKEIAQRVYDGREDAALRREVVRVPITPPPALEPLKCPKGAKARRETTPSGTIAEACVDRAGKRQGPGRAWFASTGYLLEEVTFSDDEPGAPDRRYWENGQLQRSSLVDAAGAVTVERFDPFGRPVTDE